MDTAINQVPREFTNAFLKGIDAYATAIEKYMPEAAKDLRSRYALLKQQQAKVIIQELDGYNIDDVTKALIVQIISDRPRVSKKRMAELLGCSERTVWRLLKKFNIKNWTKE